MGSFQELGNTFAWSVCYFSHFFSYVLTFAQHKKAPVSVSGYASVYIQVYGVYWFLYSNNIIQD